MIEPGFKRTQLCRLTLCRTRRAAPLNLLDGAATPSFELTPFRGAHAGHAETGNERQEGQGA